MKSNQSTFTLRLSVVAVQSAMVAMAVMSANAVRADEPTAAELSTPTSTVQVGVGGVSEKSAKFGEYNGLNKGETNADIGVEIHKGGDEGSAYRLNVYGRNLGLNETRELTGDVGEQGSFRLNFGFTELQHNISDTYQTPYTGVGSNVLRMPSTWIKPTQLNVTTNAGAGVVTPAYNANALSPAWIANDTVYRFDNFCNNNNAAGTAAGYSAWVPPVTTPVTAKTPANYCADAAYKTLVPNASGSNITSTQAAYAASDPQKAAMLATAANDNALFHSVDLYTKRTKYNLGVDLVLSNQWGLTASLSREDKQGLKPKSYLASSTETALTLPDPIDENHAQINLGLNYRGDRAFGSMAYYGSLYHNNIDGVTVEEAQGRNLATSGALLTSATPPSNQFHQLSLMGGYKFTPKTQLVADASISRGTQNQQYLGQTPGTPGYSLPTTAVPAALGSWLPATSLDGLVVTKAFDLKLTSRPTNDLNLSGAFKFNDRRNETPVHTFIFQDLNAATSGNSPYNAPLGLAASSIGSGGNGGILANRALSKQVNQLNFDADYRINKANAVQVGYDLQQVHNYCLGSWIDCASTDHTQEGTFRAEWRLKANDDLSGRLAYARSERRADAYNVNSWLALAPMANVTPDQTLLPTGGYSAWGIMQQFGLSAWGPMGQGYPYTTLGTAVTPYSNTAAQWQTALGLTSAPSAANVTAMNLLPKTAWAQYLGVTAASITDKQLAALNQYFALGNKLSGTNVATRNFLSLMPGQETPIDGDRNRDKLRAALNWQANEKLTLNGNFDYNRDNYNATSAGLTDGKSWTLNLDAAVAVTDDLSVTGFVTHENRSMTTKGPGVGSNGDGTPSTTTGALGTLAYTAANSLINTACPVYASNAAELVNAKIDPCLNWSTDVRDKVDTLGLTLRQKGLMAGKLDVSSSIGYTRATTSQTFTGGTYVSTLQTEANFGTGATTWSRTYVPATPMPDVTSTMLSFSLGGKYKLSKVSTVQAAYSFQRLRYDDWAYLNTVAGVVPSGSVPSNQTAPVYTLQTIGAAYIYSFQ